MTAASPRTSPSALRSPLPPSITHSTRPSSVSPRASRPCSSSVQTTAFSVEPRRKPSGTLPPSRVIPRTTITVCWATTTPSMNSATEPVQAAHELLVQPLPGPPHHGPADSALTTAPGGPPARPGLETAFVVSRRHPREQLLHHPRGQQVPIAI